MSGFKNRFRQPGGPGRRTFPPGWESIPYIFNCESTFTKSEQVTDSLPLSISFALFICEDHSLSMVLLHVNRPEKIREKYEYCIVLPILRGDRFL